MEDRPGIVRPAENLGAIIFDDKLKQLLGEAQAFGRTTIRQKIETGKKLIEVREEVEAHNKAEPKKKIKLWELLAARGFARTTARRLMLAATSYPAGFRPAAEFDAVYDDGYDPVADADKRPCRDCRMKGWKYSRKCPGCRALNRPTPQPKDDRVLDMDGEEVPPHLVEAFKDGATIAEFHRYLKNGTKSLAGLVERPGCKKINAAEISRRLDVTYRYAVKYAPGKVCTACEGVREVGGEPCQFCDGDGWVTKMAVLDERAAESAAKKRLDALEYHKRKNGR